MHDRQKDDDQELIDCYQHTLVLPALRVGSARLSRDAEPSLSQAELPIVAQLGFELQHTRDSCRLN